MCVYGTYVGTEPTDRNRTKQTGTEPNAQEPNQMDLRRTNKKMDNWPCTTVGGGGFPSWSPCDHKPLDSCETAVIKMLYDGL